MRPILTALENGNLSDEALAEFQRLNAEANGTLSPELEPVGGGR